MIISAFIIVPTFLTPFSPTTKALTRLSTYTQMLLILNIACISFYLKKTINIVKVKIKNKLIRISSKKIYTILGGVLMAVFFCTFALYSSLWAISESSGTFMYVETDDLKLANELASCRCSVTAILLPLPKGRTGDHYLFAASFPLLVKESDLSSIGFIKPLISKNNIRLLNVNMSKVEALAIYMGMKQDLDAKCFRENGFLCTDSRYVQFTKFSYFKIVNGTIQLCTTIHNGQHYVQYPIYDPSVQYVVLGIVTSEKK